jgi:hypothetical protein
MHPPAATAPEGGTPACPSALVTMKPCREVFSRQNTLTYSLDNKEARGGIIGETFFGAEVTGGSMVGGGCWSWLQTTGKRRRGRALVACRLTRCGRVDPKGAARHKQRGGLSRREERRGLAGAILRINRRRKTMYGGFCDNVRTPRPERSSNGDHALPHRYPLSTCTPNIRECEPESTRRLELETRVLDGRAIGGGGYGRWLVFQTCTRVPNRKKPPGRKNVGRGILSSRRQER